MVSVAANPTDPDLRPDPCLGRGGEYPQLRALRHSPRRAAQLPEDGATGFSRYRRAEVEPLSALAIQLSQAFELLCRLDSLGDELQSQALRHAHDGADNGRIVGINCHVAHERAIDLECIDGQMLQVAQAGVARPEVIDEDARPQVP